MKAIGLSRPARRLYRVLLLVSAIIGLQGCQPVRRLNLDGVTLANREAFACMQGIAQNPANRQKSALRASLTAKLQAIENRAAKGNR